MLYRRKPTTVEAVQWDGHAMPGVTMIENEGLPSATGYVLTIQGQHVLIRVGEWVAEEAGSRHHHYPIADDVFQKIYERAIVDAEER